MHVSNKMVLMIDDILWIDYVFFLHDGCTGADLRLLGAPGWNLERGPISNEEGGGKRIYFGIGPLNGGGPRL